MWIFVFQLVLGRIATTILYEYFEATLCPLDPRLVRRLAIITVIQTVQTAPAVIAVVAYERRMKQHLHGNRTTAKLIHVQADRFV